jgi:hypothetical protein
MFGTITLKKVQKETTVLEYVPSNSQVAEILTKHLAKEKSEMLRECYPINGRHQQFETEPSSTWLALGFVHCCDKFDMH